MEIRKKDTLLLGEIVDLIELTRAKTIQQVNSSLTLLYWHIGKHINEHVLQNERAGYGEQTIKNISLQLSNLYGKGYSERNLANMMQFQELFSENILQSLIAKLTWTHFIQLLSIKEPLKREFYATICYNEHWSVRTLKERINSMLYERTALSKMPDLTIENDLQALRENKEMSISLALRDPYILDFLELKDTYSEKDLEQSIINELQQFILELGSDFAFMARQKRISIDNEDYYIDLLFFHRKLNRLIAIELKLGKFEYQHKAQMELYLRWLAKYEQNSTENPPIGLILCADKSEQLVELLELDKQSIHVATYFRELPDVEILKLKLRQSIANAKNRIDNTIDNG